jgi:hypothetical protein
MTRLEIYYFLRSPSISERRLGTEMSSMSEGLYPDEPSRVNLRIAWRRLRRANGRSPCHEAYDLQMRAQNVEI